MNRLIDPVSQELQPWGQGKAIRSLGRGPDEDPLLDTVFCTPPVVNPPGSIASAIRFLRNTLQDRARRPLRVLKGDRLINSPAEGPRSPESGPHPRTGDTTGV